MKNRKILITGTSGFIGFHIANNFLKKKLYKYTLYLADIVLANSIKFKNILRTKIFP